MKRIVLKGTDAAILADIRNLERDGEYVYPNYPEGYEKRFGTDCYVITDITKQVDDEGVESEDFFCCLVIPETCDISALNTVFNA